MSTRPDAYKAALATSQRPALAEGPAGVASWLYAFFDSAATGAPDDYFGTYGVGQGVARNLRLRLPFRRVASRCERGSPIVPAHH